MVQWPVLGAHHHVKQSNIRPSLSFGAPAPVKNTHKVTKKFNKIPPPFQKVDFKEIGH